MHFSLQAHCQKDEKQPFSRSIFATARLGFHFLFIFHSFSVSILRKIGNGKWIKNEWKMDQKCQLWTTLILAYYIWLRIANGTLIWSYRVQYKVYLHQTPYIHSIHTLKDSMILRGFKTINWDCRAMTEKRDEKTEISKPLSLLCHIEF